MQRRRVSPLEMKAIGGEAARGALRSRACGCMLRSVLEVSAGNYSGSRLVESSNPFRMGIFVVERYDRLDWMGSNGGGGLFVFRAATGEVAVDSSRRRSDLDDVRIYDSRDAGDCRQYYRGDRGGVFFIVFKGTERAKALRH